MRELFDLSRKTFGMLRDDMSRRLYEKRVMYSLTGDESFIYEMLESFRIKDKMDAMMAELSKHSDRLVIRGAGNDFKTLKYWYPDMQFLMFCDNDPVKIASGICYGKKVVSPQEFYEEYRDHPVLINSVAYNEEILQELRGNGIPEDHIFNPRDCYERNFCDSQYFDDEIIRPVPHEVFVDGGAYDGATSLRFAKWCGGDFDRIYAFEADKKNYELCREKTADKIGSKMLLFNSGLWDKKTTLRFAAEGSQGSCITEGGDGITIETVSIDEAVGDAPVTFIKLDVEGAELRTLMGAKNTIMRHRPRLAISIYHKPEDVFEIPDHILSLRDDYRLYIRHYQMSSCETILYAV